MNRTTWTALSGLALSACAAAPESGAPTAEPGGLLPPVRLEAGGELIDHGECVGHTGPFLLDLDEDGAQDLLVGDFHGDIHVYRNTGTNRAPVYAQGTKLEVDGEEVRIHNW